MARSLLDPRLWSLLVLFGCPFDHNLDDVRDGDHDGHEAIRFGGDDCDDGDPDVNPDVEEDWANDLDDDCDADWDDDGAADETDCDPLDPAFQQAQQWYPDVDQDGVPSGTSYLDCHPRSEGDSTSPAEVDCDDGDPARFPGSDEACDELDNDCDTEIDEGLPQYTYHVDFDQDGHGIRDTQVVYPEFGPDPGGTLVTCLDRPPAGYADDATDCNDQDPDVAVLVFYQDLDLDQFGDPSVPDDSRCVASMGWTVDGTDCVDTDPEQHPGATWHEDLDQDGFGAYEVASDTCERPSVLISDGRDCDDHAPTVHPGAGPELVHDGVDTNCDDQSEFDGPDAGTQPDLGCLQANQAPIDVTPQSIQAELDALDPADACATLVLAEGKYGSVTLPGGMLALIAAPFAQVMFESTTGGQALHQALGPVPPALDLLVEKVSFRGWDTAIHVRGPITLSEVQVEGGVAVSSPDNQDSLEIYDSSFRDLTLVYDPTWSGPGKFDHVRLERVDIDQAVAANTVLAGGRLTTTWIGLTVTDSAAIVGLLQPSWAISTVGRRTTVVRDLSVTGSIGRIIDVAGGLGDEVELTGVTLRDNYTVDRSLVGVDGAEVRVTDLVATGNLMDALAGTGLEDAAMFDFGTGGVDLRYVDLVDNSTGASWLLQGQGSGYALTLMGLGEQGLHFVGVLDHVTLVGFDDVAATLGALTLQNALVDHSGGVLIGVRLERTLVDATSTVRCQVTDGPCDDGVPDLGFLRSDVAVPIPLVDLRVLPTSPALQGCGFGGGCDLGGHTPDTADTASAEARRREYDDLDLDGIYDTWEEQFFDTMAACLPTEDPDADGLTNLQEFRSGTLPREADVDQDGFSDGPTDDFPWDPLRH